MDTSKYINNVMYHCEAKMDDEIVHFSVMNEYDDCCINENKVSEIASHAADLLN